MKALHPPQHCGLGVVGARPPLSGEIGIYRIPTMPKLAVGCRIIRRPARPCFYAGRVGTGIPDEVLADLRRRLDHPPPRAGSVSECRRPRLRRASKRFMRAGARGSDREADH